MGGAIDHSAIVGRPGLATCTPSSNSHEYGKLCENCPSVNIDTDGISFTTDTNTDNNSWDKFSSYIDEPKSKNTSYKRLEKLEDSFFSDLMKGGG